MTHTQSRRTGPVIPQWGLLAILTVALALCGCEKGGGPKNVKTRDASIAVTVAPVEVAAMDQTLPVLGTLLPYDEATVASQVEGQVEKTLVDFGSTVTNGQELASIDTEAYQAKATQAAANLSKARANAQNAEQNLIRVRALQESRISSTSDLDLATAQAEQARAEVKAAEAAEAIARLDLARSHARAPFNGAVAERIGNAGDYVKIGAPLFRLVNDNQLKYIVAAPERYAGKVKAGQSVRFSVDAIPGRTFEGAVYLINPTVSTTTRSFTVAALVENGDRTLKANSFARGDLLLEKGVPTMLVPLNAVINFAGITKVFVVETNTAHAREVRTGRIQAGKQEVLEGLKAEDRVVTSGQTKLYEGAPVRLTGTQLEAAK